MALEQIVGPGMEFVKQAFKAERHNDQVSKPSAKEGAARSKSMNFGQALTNKAHQLSHAPAQVTAKISSPQSRGFSSPRAEGCALAACAA